ncbi:hypothetical protein F4821DRAFT_280910 [Hypoxylon rubiginosum]|uniref:Uncharacterized protein n=1 Tax=Hypoxylon rubiginosum TaxID=110542 RepID=A0ACC0CSG9_9PEZI|nr:hypothetical protein F4821DRAFT_280910 [Hypoxylon rubiginosum]
MASSRVFGNDALLVKILAEVPERDLLSSAKRVSKRWEHVIDSSTTINELLFLGARSTSFDEDNYTKNPMLSGIFKDYFGMGTLGPQGFTTIRALKDSIDPEKFMLTRFVDDVGNLEETLHTRHVKKKINLLEYKPDEDFNDFDPVLYTHDSSWVAMNISQPPITKMSWEIYRNEGDNMFDEFHRGYPVAIATFNFPDGIRMLRFYDLVLGTLGCHKVRWPLQRGSPEPDNNSSSLVPQSSQPLTLQETVRVFLQWKANLLTTADRDNALTIRQTIWDSPEAGDEWWTKWDLEVYHWNLVELKIRVIDDKSICRYTTQHLSSTDMMKRFLVLAKTPRLENLSLRPRDGMYRLAMGGTIL